MHTGLADRSVLVTGVSGGIGHALARAFVAEGARVVAHFRRPSERASALAGELAPACRPLGADLTSEAEVEWLFAEAEAAHGPVEILVANAGSWPPDSVLLKDMILARCNETLAVSLTSDFLCVRALFRGVARHRLLDPAAVLIGSTAGIFGEAAHADYSAAKAGLSPGLARSLKNGLFRNSVSAASRPGRGPTSSGDPRAA